MAPRISDFNNLKSTFDFLEYAEKQLGCPLEWSDDEKCFYIHQEKGKKCNPNDLLKLLPNLVSASAKSEETAHEILEAFMDFNGGKEKAIDKISKEVSGELDEFYHKDLPGHMLYGNREALIYVDGEEEPYVLVVDTYGGKKVLVWT